MLQKMTLTEFYNFKLKLSQELEKAQKEYDERISDKSLTQEEINNIESEIIKKYIIVQNELFNYDLSDIPFEAWEEIHIFSFDFLDLSKTHANLDFKIIDFSSENGVDIRGCNVRNLTNNQILIHENFVDEQVRKDFPNLFLSEIFSTEFKNIFYNKKLSIDDLINLNEEQLNELDQKDIHRYLFSLNNNERELYNLIGKIPLKNYIDIYKQDIEFLKDLGSISKTFYFQDDELQNIIKNEQNIETLKNKIDELFNNIIYSEDYFSIKPRMFSENFKLRHRSIFPLEQDLPEDVIKRLNNNELSLEDVIKYNKSFYDTDLSNYMKYNYELKYYLNLFKTDFAKIVGKYPHIFLNSKQLLNSYNIERKIIEFYENTKENSKKNNIPFDCLDAFMQGLMRAYFGSNGLEYSSNATPDIYKETMYPDWVKETGYYLSGLHNMDDYYLPLISSKTEIKEQELKLLFDTLGLHNIKKMYHENFFFTPIVIRVLAHTIKNLDIKPATSYEDFQDKLIYLIFKTHNYERKYILEELRKIKPSYFRERNSSVLLPIDAPEKLQDLFYSSNATLSELISKKDWIPYLKGIDLNRIGLSFKVNAINSSFEGKQAHQEIDFIPLYLKAGTNEELLIFLNKYKDYISDTLSYYIDIKDSSKEGLENCIKKAIYNHILTGYIKVRENTPQEFKDEYPDIFIASSAPESLKSLFYNRFLSLEELGKHPEWISYIKHINPKLISQLPLNFNVINSEFGKENQLIQQISIKDIYINKYGLDEYLKFILPYGNLVEEAAKYGVIDLVDDSKDALEIQIEKAIYRGIVERRSRFNENLPTRFKKAYQNIFLSSDAPEELKIKFYERSLKYEDLRKNPEYKKYLKDVEPLFAFTSDKFLTFTDDLYADSRSTIPQVLKYISKEEFLELVTLYGEYFSKIGINPEILQAQTFEDLKLIVEKRIIDVISNEGSNYGYIKYQEDAPDFLKKALPSYFLDPSAPAELKKYYYQYNPNYQIDFLRIGKNPEWIPYLKDKSLKAAFEKVNSSSVKRESIKYIELFTQEKALKYAVARTETVDKMIDNSKVDVMYEWWLKTGKKFIPDYVVMQSFPVEEIDKFLSHGKDWSYLMRNKRFALSEEGRDSMLKLAYTFGIFDNDQQALKKLDIILYDIPRKLSSSDIERLLKDERTSKNYIFEQDIEAMQREFEGYAFGYEPTQERRFLISPREYDELKSELKKEGFDVKGDLIFNELYRINEDGTATLKINTQMYPKSTELLRKIMEKLNISNVISADRAHTMFGGFELKYDKDFREFLLSNLEVFMNNSEYTKYISAIQKQFQLIKVTNSNRVLTPDLAVSFVQENKYDGIELGNEELARVSSIAGYSQADFDTLQKIYNYGKERVTSSIPRVEGKKGKFIYEILRLTDPLAVAIGTLTDCCQEINNVAELCMEHSMVDKHGRLFLIKDEEGNYVSQSWVWRNGNVLCFDNVEIPDKQLLKSGMSRNEVGTGARNDFTDEILSIYQQAAKELIEEDERIYKELLENGLITEEQYEGLKLRKVTVGSGYNDIGASIKANFKVDSEKVSRPISFTPPVELSRNLYINDSTTQYVIEKTEEEKEKSPSKYVGPTIPVHFDKFMIYDKTNISKNEIRYLERLEIASGRYSYQMNTQVSDYTSSETIMDELSDNYGISIDEARTMINPNFAIIYRETEQEIAILDLLSNLKTTSKEKVLLQLKLAILQLISTGKNLKLDYLRNKELQLMNEIMDISEEKILEERGVSHGTK